MPVQSVELMERFSLGDDTEVTDRGRFASEPFRVALTVTPSGLAGRPARQNHASSTSRALSCCSACSISATGAERSDEWVPATRHTNLVQPMKSCGSRTISPLSVRSDEDAPD
jgi:hypothetical protein